VVNVPADNAIEPSLLAVSRKVLLEVKHEAHGLLHLVLQVSRQRPVPKAQLSTHPVEFGVEIQNNVICFIAEETYPWHYSVDSVEHVSVYNKITFAVCPSVFVLIVNLYVAEGELIWHECSQELIMIAGNVDNLGSFLGEGKNLTHDVGVVLIPAPTILLYLPAVNNVANKIESVARVVFQKVNKMKGLTVP
jgi:hypothetical protein